VVNNDVPLILHHVCFWLPIGYVCAVASATTWTHISRCIHVTVLATEHTTILGHVVLAGKHSSSLFVFDRANMFKQGRHARLK
jgi:hypothetical protein